MKTKNLKVALTDESNNINLQMNSFYGKLPDVEGYTENKISFNA